MHCKVCPAFKYVQAIAAWRHGTVVDHALLEDALARTDELRGACVRCHMRARKCDTHLSYDAEGGSLHGEIAFDKDAIFAPGMDQGDFTVAADYHPGRTDGANGCTAELAPDAEDTLRKAIATVIENVEIVDAGVLLALLKREPLKAACGGENVRAYAVRAREVLDVLDVARRMVRVDKPTRRAAGKLVDALCELTPKDAPIVAGMLRRVPLAETARQAKLRNRATAHARLKTLLARFPSLRALHHSAAK